jgi:hypothetical protein
MRRAADTGDDDLWTWPDELNGEDEYDQVKLHRRRPGAGSGPRAGSGAGSRLQAPGSRQ